MRQVELAMYPPAVQHVFVTGLICRVCHRPLEQFSSGGVLKFSHAAGVYPNDHRPEPAVAAEVGDEVLVCDLCGAPSPTWEYKVQGFKMDLPNGGCFLSLDNWVACEACYEAVEAEEWKPIWHRWLENHAEAMLDLTHQQLKVQKFFHQAQYQLFRANQDGPPWRLYPPDLGS